MESASFDQIDAHVETLFHLDDPQLAGALADARAAGLPAIEVSPVQGRLLTVLALAVGARRILEVGTLGGYSSICLARALPPEGRMVTLELSERHAAVARGNLARAGLAERVEVRVGPAAASLEALAAEGARPFDLVFIDADKDGYPDYFRLALALTRPGGLILADNVLRRAVIPVPGEDGANAAGIRSFNAMIARDHGQRATILPLAGRKGVDGMALVVVGEQPDDDMNERFRGSAEDWDRRYTANPAGYGTEPNAFVRQVAGQIPDGPVLCLAEGQGRNAVYLAQLGHEVLAVDQSEVALRRAAELAAERGVQVRIQVADLADFAIAPGVWSGIVATFLHVPSELRRRVLAAAVDGLKPGGVFILEAFAIGQLGRGSGGPRSADLLLSVDLLREELAGLAWVELRELERDLDEGPLHQGPSLVVQVLGRKPVY